MATVVSDIPICRGQPPSTRESIIGRFLTTLALYNCVERDIIVSGLRLWQEIHTTLFKESREIPNSHITGLMFTPEVFAKECHKRYVEILMSCSCFIIGRKSSLTILVIQQSLKNGYFLAWKMFQRCSSRKKYAFLRLKAPRGVHYVKNPSGRFLVDINEAIGGYPSSGREVFEQL